MDESTVSRLPESDALAEVAQLRRELARERAVNLLLQDASMAAGATTTFREAVQAALAAVCLHLECVTAHAYFLNSDESIREPALELWYATGGQSGVPSFVASAGPAGDGGGPIIRATGPGHEPVWIEDVRTEPTFRRYCSGELAGFGAGLVVPITHGGKVVAVLEFLKAAPETRDPRVLEALATLSRQLSEHYDRLRTQNLLRAREEHLQAMFDAEPSCIKLVAADGTLMEMNDTGMAMVEAEHRSQLVGQPIASLLIPEYRQAFEDFHHKVINGWTGTLQIEIMGLRGTRLWMETHAAPLRAPNGEICHLAVSVDITERKRAEEVIRYIASHVRCLLWHAEVSELADGELLWTVHVSDEQAAQRFFPVEVTPGKDYAECWFRSRSPEDQARTDAHAAAQLRAGQSFLQEYQATDRTGKTRWLREDVHVEAVAPARWRVVGICTDVTAQRGAQAALRKREELLRQVLDNLPVGVWVIDAHGQIVRTNPAGERIWAGVADAEERDPHDYQPPVSLGEREPPCPDQYAATCAITHGGPLLNQEFSIVCADASRKTILSSSVPLRNPDGSVAGAILVNEDITDRKRAERRNLAFQALGAQLNAALSPQDAARTILSVANELVGWDSCWLDVCDLETRIVHPVIRIDQVDGLLQEFPSPTRVLSETSLAARAMEEGPLLIDRAPEDSPGSIPDGRSRFGNVDRPSEAILVVPIRLGSRFIGALSIQSYTPKAYDSTDLDTLQALADYCAGALERARAEELRRSLEHQLQQSQKLEAIGRLAGGVAHDFNNMLAVISGYSELMLMRDTLDSQDQMALEEIRAACERAAGLTSQLLAFSRKSMVQPEVLRMNDAVANMERMLERVIGEDIRLSCLLDPLAGFVRVDRSQLDQVLLNLVVNARDAMPLGGTLRIETREASVQAAGNPPELSPGKYVLLTVSDNGCGMSEETLAHLWEPFFTTKPTGEGTGLGLATVYGIVKQHGGHVEVESVPGEGSTFHVYLPQIAPAMTTSATTMAEPPEPPAPGGPETILVLEDEEMLRRLIALVLSQAGYRVIEAADGTEALRLAEGNLGTIHLLLADVVIPGGISGRIVAQRVAEGRPDTRILMMSGYTDDAVLRHGVESGAAPFIQKPFAPGALVRKVREVLTGPVGYRAEEQ